MDGSYQARTLLSKAGWVFRDSLGYYRRAGQAVGTKIQSDLESELHAIIMAMQHAWCKVIIESDSKKAIDILNDKLLHFDVYNWKP